MSNLANLFPALVECFVIILFGYISGRMKIVTPAQGRGIGNFVGTFALPALLFKSMVELNFTTVSWAFMVAVLLGKTVVFIIVLIFTIILVKPRGMACGSLYAIFTTQSNDFALGYPLIQALYSETHPEFLQYIYLLAPISLLILNPIGFLLLEIDKIRGNTQSEYTAVRNDTSPIEKRRNEVGTESDNDSINTDIGEAPGNEESAVVEDITKFTKWTCFNLFKGVVLNPLVFMVFIGLIGHFVFQGVLPTLLTGTLTTLANAFSGAALFYLGLTMVGKIGQQRGSGLLIPASLIAAKIILLPILIREFVIGLSGVLPVYRPDNIPRNSTNMTDYIYNLADFGYLYGTFPTAPTVVIFAAKYEIEVDRLASGMVFCTSLSAPIMYVSAWTLSMTRMSVKYFQQEVQEVDKDISIISLFCSVWCMVIFILGRKFLKVPHVVTFAYICALFLSSLGTILWDSINIGKISVGSREFIFGMMFFGIQSARLLTASMALTLIAVLTYGPRWVWKHYSIFIAVPFILSFLMTVLLMSLAENNTTDVNRVFEYGKPQNILSLVVLLLSFLVTVVSLVFIIKIHGHSDEQRKYNRHGTSEEETETLLERFDTNFESSSTEDEDDPFEASSKRKCCMFITTRRGFGNIQKSRHVVLLLLLVLSMFIGLCLVIWKLTKMKQIGIFFELSFLDSVFNFGQGFFIFCVFGLDSNLIIEPCIRLWRKLRYGTEDISLPALSDVDRDILLKCLQFTRHHLDECKLDILGEHQSGLSMYSHVFRGTDLCTWLVDRGLVSDRIEACNYGQNLMLGRVLYHHKRKHYFHDQKYLYKFEDPKTCFKVKLVKPVINPDDESSGPSVPGPSSQSTLKPIKYTGFQSSPAKKWFHGFSFEAYVLSSDTESQFSPRRQRLIQHSSNKDDQITVSVNNNCNLSDSSVDDFKPPNQQRKKKFVSSSSGRKAELKKTKEKVQGTSSDSSF